MGPDGTRHAPDPHLLKRPERPTASDWLALRREADTRAREASRPLLERLTGYYAAGAETVVDVVDVGAGTGANLAWLAPRLPMRQRWTLLDHDPALLELADAPRDDDRVVDVARVVAGIEDLATLPRVLRSPCLVTCSAVLDVLTVEQLDGLCDLLATRRLPALFALNVDGTVELSPEHHFDERITAVFNDHQRRGTLLGPAAVTHAEQRLRAAGMTVDVMDTPWLLDAQDGPLLRRYLRERADVVIEQNPSLREETEEWLAQRLECHGEDRLRARVGHRDLLCLPPG